MTTIDTDGVWKRGCTRATALKSRRSSAIAKKMRGEVRIDPSSVLNVAIITTIATSPTPARPMISCAASAATSGERAIGPIGMR